MLIAGVPLLLQNPQADLQAQDRCHRIGQTKPVVVYRLVTANTIDQKILERASAKRKLEQMVIHKSERSHTRRLNWLWRQRPRWWTDEQLHSLAHLTLQINSKVGGRS